MKTTLPENIQSMDSTAWMAILAAVTIIGFILFAKAVKATLKTIVIGVMLVLIAYFLRQAGII